MMELVDLTPTPTEALPMAEFKAHLRLGSGFSDDAVQDAVLESYLRAALAAIETRIGKALYRRSFEWLVSRWMAGGSQPLPVAPVSAVTELALISFGGDAEIVSAENYGLEKDTHRPRLFARGACLPAIPSEGAARLRFDAGFGGYWTAIPADLRQAVLMLAAHYYEHRNDTSGAGGLVPFGVSSLIEAHRNIRVFGARS